MAREAREDAIMLIAPGMAIIKNSFTGAVFAYTSEPFIISSEMFCLCFESNFASIQVDL